MSAFTFLDGAFLAATQVPGDGGGGGADADADAYIALLGGTYSGAEEDAIDAFVVSLKGRTLSDGGSQWASLQGFWIRALDTAADSRLNLKGTSYPLTDTGTPTFTAREGMALAGYDDMLDVGDYFKPGIVPSELSLSSTAGLIGTYTRGAWVEFGYLFGARSTIDFSEGISLLADGSTSVGARFQASGENFSTTTPLGAVSAGFNGTTVKIYNNAVASIGTAATATDYADQDLLFGAFREDDLFGAYVGQFAACWCCLGTAWTDAEVAAFHADVETLLDVFGAGVIS